eukprot:8829627-Pyramimonas_sp.AAC.1
MRVPSTVIDHGVTLQGRRAHGVMYIMYLSDAKFQNVEDERQHTSGHPSSISGSRGANASTQYWPESRWPDPGFDLISCFESRYLPSSAVASTAETQDAPRPTTATPTPGANAQPWAPG